MHSNTHCRSALPIVFVSACFALTACTNAARNGDAGGQNSVAGPAYTPTAVAASTENPGEQCAKPTLPAASSLPAINGLPDPFLLLNGKRISSKSQWWCRRQEMLEQAQTYIYGPKPPRPEKVSGTVAADKITVNVQHEGKGIEFTAQLTLPPGTGPFPVVIGYGGGMFGTGVPRPMATVLAEQGIATIAYNPYDLGTENGGPRTEGAGRFYDLYGSKHPAGLLVAWGYGVSRIIDVLEQDPNRRIDTQHIGITGCSRFGKGPFVASAFDARIALTMPVESGIGGVPSVKMVPVTDPAGEQPAHALNYQKWYSPSAFTFFTDKLDRLPVDTHQTIGLIAPRGLLVIDNPPPGGVANLDPNAGYGATLAGAKIYEALGFKDNIGYVGAGGGHCQWRAEYTEPMTAAVKRFLKGDQTAKLGSFTTNGTPVDMNPWITWQVPTLSGQLPR